MPRVRQMPEMYLRGSLANETMKHLAEERDLLLVDPYPVMRDPKTFVDAAHVNPQGMILKAQIVYEGIISLVNIKLRKSQKVHMKNAMSENRGVFQQIWILVTC